MANKSMKHPSNVSGTFYCTSPEDPNGEGCTACTICYTAAPEFFAEDSEGYAYVKEQPETESDIELCQAQLDACPPAAIGNDG
jgi:ferredoxin